MKKQAWEVKSAGKRKNVFFLQPTGGIKRKMDIHDQAIGRKKRQLTKGKNSKIMAKGRGEGKGEGV